MTVVSFFSLPYFFPSLLSGLATRHCNATTLDWDKTIDYDQCSNVLVSAKRKFVDGVGVLGFRDGVRNFNSESMHVDHGIV